MNILVYDVAAESGGALTILQQFYRQHKRDQENHYFYLLSVADLESEGNIEVIKVPWIKKTWLHRLVFDYFVAPKLIKRYYIDKVLSLQNTHIPNVNVPQTVYVHNALPFSEHKFGFMENRYLWVYQNLIGKIIKQSIRRADEVIVQTEWMKKAIERDVKNREGTIEVEFPAIDGFAQNSFAPEEACIFFYPANSSEFKNHRLILKAAKLLNSQGVSEYQCVFTLNGNETNGIREMYEEGKQIGLPFGWVGQIPKEEMESWYSKSILLFPSYIETVGLPIYEAATVGAPLLLARCEYTKDVAKRYANVEYFDAMDSEELALCMHKEIMGWKNQFNEG